MHAINPPRFPPHELILKKGMPLIILRNINLFAGLANGTRVILLKAYKYSLLCTIMSNQPKDVLIPRIALNIPIESSSVPFVRKQFPVSCSFAMTINKSIGATFNNEGLCMCFHQCWTHGQLYLAMSRVRDGSKITYLVSQDPQTHKPNYFLNNVVFPEALC